MPPCAPPPPPRPYGPRSSRRSPGRSGRPSQAGIHWDSWLQVPHSRDLPARSIPHSVVKIRHAENPSRRSILSPGPQKDRTSSSGPGDGKTGTLGGTPMSDTMEDVTNLEPARAALAETFGYGDFRPGQAEVI